MSAVNIKQIKEALGATVLEGPDDLEIDVSQVYASDLMSDVLAFGKTDSILFTGLATQQAIISAHMAEFKGVMLVRGTIPKDNSVKMARDTDPGWSAGRAQPRGSSLLPESGCLRSEGDLHCGRNVSLCAGQSALRELCRAYVR